METLLPIVAGLFCLVVSSGVLSVPAVWLGVRAVRKDPANATRRALGWALGNGAWCGVALGLGGFVFGAGIGDESAGAIAQSLLAGGGLGGLLAGAAVSYAAITLWARPPRSGPTDPSR